MDFPDAFRRLKAGGRVRRRLWTTLDAGDWLELVERGGFAPALMIWWDDRWVTWGGVHLDILEDDWEIA